MDLNNLSQRSEEIVDSPEKLKSEYLTLLQRYQDKVTTIKNLKSGVVGSVVDKQIDFKTRELDKERNTIHKQLKNIGNKVGRSEVDIMTDILRQQGSLAEYGLAEFVILTANDLTGMTFNSLHVDGGRIAIGNPRVFDYHDAFDHSHINDDKVLFVYEVMPQCALGHFEGYLRSKDYFIREKRAKRLAKDLKLKVFQARDYQYFHDSTVSVMGVIVPKNRLVEVAEQMRKKPMEYRIGKEFYSEEENDYIEGAYKQMIEEDIGERNNNDRPYYLRARKRAFGDE